MTKERVCSCRLTFDVAWTTAGRTVRSSKQKFQSKLSRFFFFFSLFDRFVESKLKIKMFNIHININITKV